MCPPPGVQFDGRNPQVNSSCHCLGSGIDKETHPTSSCSEAIDGFDQSAIPPTQVESTLGRDLLSALRNECCLVWPQVTHELYDTGVGGEFDVQHRGTRLGETKNVVVVDVTAILTEVGGNPLGTCRLTETGRVNRIRLIGATCLSDRGDVIDVDIEPKRSH
jgi:hypothetical protein